jgi:ABC-type lipoprotein release transport system permease subunit
VDSAIGPATSQDRRARPGPGPGRRLRRLDGVTVGLAGALVFTRTLRNFVYGVSTLDPATFAAVSALLIAVAAAASLVPALRATRLNPTTALRD